MKLFQADVEQTVRRLPSFNRLVPFVSHNVLQSANEEELSEITREQKELETEIQSLQEQLRNNIGRYHQQALRRQHLTMVDVARG